MYGWALWEGEPCSTTGAGEGDKESGSCGGAYIRVWNLSKRAAYSFESSVSEKDPKGPKIEKIQDLEIFKRDWKFQASHPLNPFFFVGNSEGRDWNFQSRLKISSEIENFNRDWIFSIFGPLGEIRWPGDSQRNSGQFARIDSHKSIRRRTSISSHSERFRANRLKTAIRNF